MTQQINKKYAGLWLQNVAKNWCQFCMHNGVTDGGKNLFARNNLTKMEA